jgi:hypothetical protein
MATKNIVLPVAMTALDSATFTGAYQLLSAATGIPAACIIVRFVNDSSRDVTVSYDGVNDHEFVPSLSALILNFQANAQPTPFVSCMAAGTKISVKGAVLGTGSVYLAGYYNPQGI